MTLAPIVFEASIVYQDYIFDHACNSRTQVIVLFGISCTSLGSKQFHCDHLLRGNTLIYMYLPPKCPQSWKDPPVFLKSLRAGGKNSDTS